MAVVLDHAGLWGFEAGGLGVDVFFTLSGFLITSLLLNEWSSTGRVDFGRFWLRRALRLLPALFALLLGVMVLLPWLPPGTVQGVIPTLLYYTNWHRALVGDVGALGHTWSLSIEEQFYLIWPLALVGMLRLKDGVRIAMRWAVCLAVAVVICREVAFQGHLVTLDRIYNGSDFRADGLLIGCALALSLHAGVAWSWLSNPRLVTAALTVFGLIFIGCQLWTSPTYLIRTVAAVAAVSVICATRAGSMPRLDAVLSHPLARWLGVRSYAIYLWHYPIWKLLEHQPPVLEIPAVVILSLAAAALSYRYVEAPALKLKADLGRKAAVLAA